MGEDLEEESLQAGQRPGNRVLFNCSGFHGDKERPRAGHFPSGGEREREELMEGGGGEKKLSQTSNI